MFQIVSSWLFFPRNETFQIRHTYFRSVINIDVKFEPDLQKYAILKTGRQGQSSLQVKSQDSFRWDKTFPPTSQFIFVHLGDPPSLLGFVSKQYFSNPTPQKSLKLF